MRIKLQWVVQIAIDRSEKNFSYGCLEMVELIFVSIDEKGREFLDLSRAGLLLDVVAARVEIVDDAPNDHRVILWQRNHWRLALSAGQLTQRFEDRRKGENIFMREELSLLRANVKAEDLRGKAAVNRI